MLLRVVLNLWLLALFAAGLLVFARGFLLSKLTLPQRSRCEDVHSLLPVPHDNESSSSHSHEKNELASSFCWWRPARFDRVVLLVIDALRHDFAVFNSTEAEEQRDKRSRFRNRLPVLHDALIRQPDRAMLFRFEADPPTTTLQRLKAITTGSLPTMVDAGANFASDALNEDNLIEILRSYQHDAVMMGDDTWLALFPDMFTRHYAYPSFNVWDLHTVDQGVKRHIFDELSAPRSAMKLGEDRRRHRDSERLSTKNHGNEVADNQHQRKHINNTNNNHNNNNNNINNIDNNNSEESNRSGTNHMDSNEKEHTNHRTRDNHDKDENDDKIRSRSSETNDDRIHHDNDTKDQKNITDSWKLLVAHMLGVDHCGHRFGPDSDAMADKLDEMNAFLTDLLPALPDRTLLLVMGDHGMTFDGDHGGDSADETGAALFAYSPDLPWMPADYHAADLLTKLFAVSRETSSSNKFNSETHDIMHSIDFAKELMHMNRTDRFLRPVTSVRAIPQIDLVPTIALLLGLPIPFGNLGAIIPELLLLPAFSEHVAHGENINGNSNGEENGNANGEENGDVNGDANRDINGGNSDPLEAALLATRHLCSAVRINAHQLRRYLFQYSSISGLSIRPQELEETFNAAEALYLQHENEYILSPLPFQNADRSANHTSKRSKNYSELLEQRLAVVFDIYMRFSHYLRAALDACREIWARFDLSTIFIGIAIMMMSSAASLQIFVYFASPSLYQTAIDGTIAVESSTATIAASSALFSLLQDVILPLVGSVIGYAVSVASVSIWLDKTALYSIHEHIATWCPNDLTVLHIFAAAFGSLMGAMIKGTFYSNQTIKKQPQSSMSIVASSSSHFLKSSTISSLSFSASDPNYHSSSFQLQKSSSPFFLVSVSEIAVAVIAAIFCFGALFASNSFIVWENKIVSYFLTSMMLLRLRSCLNHGKDALPGLLSVIVLRASVWMHTCRDEQGLRCIPPMDPSSPVTIVSFATSASSSPASQSLDDWIALLMAVSQLLAMLFFSRLIASHFSRWNHEGIQGKPSSSFSTSPSPSTPLSSSTSSSSSSSTLSMLSSSSTSTSSSTSSRSSISSSLVPKRLNSLFGTLIGAEKLWLQLLWPSALCFVWLGWHIDLLLVKQTIGLEGQSQASLDGWKLYLPRVGYIVAVLAFAILGIRFFGLLAIKVSKKDDYKLISPPRMSVSIVLMICSLSLIATTLSMSSGGPTLMAAMYCCLSCGRLYLGGFELSSSTTLSDSTSLPKTKSGAIGSASTSSFSTAAQPSLSTAAIFVWGVSIWLMARHAFFSTGHHATLSSLRWDSAFVGFDEMDFVRSGSMVVLNTIAGPLMVYLCSLHQVSVSFGGKLDRRIVAFTAISAFLVLSSSTAAAAFAAHFRRHLMVWKVFAPRFMFAAIESMTFLAVATVSIFGSSS